MAEFKKPVMLMILDGFGLGDVNDPANAVAKAKKPNLDSLFASYPKTTLKASGLAVGLPEGQMGNSEVGHLNLGAGRVVYQELTRISKDIEEGTFFEKPVLKAAFERAKGKVLHCIGLLSDGGVHSHMDHLKAIIKGAKEAGVQEVLVHAILDGRDVAPKSALTYIEDLEAYMADIAYGKIATISGRYYAMDRDKRWDRVEKAYQMMVGAKAEYTAETAKEAVLSAYDRGETDEFIVPTVISSVESGFVEQHATIIFFNFRPDRARELVAAFTHEALDGFVRPSGYLAPWMATMTKYDDVSPVEVIYKKELLTNTLGSVVSRAGKTQLRIAETEKYAHVTYFFNGGLEEVFEGEDRILVPSPKVATYDLQPAMSAVEVTNCVVEGIQNNLYDVIVLNFANPDMVGHTGVFEAAVAAVEAVDTCVGRVVEAILAADGAVLITADHGNADIMVNHETGSPHTAHTMNPVPLLLVSHQYKNVSLESGKLCDIAPTMLALIGLEQPEEMTGHSLLIQ